MTTDRFAADRPLTYTSDWRKCDHGKCESFLIDRRLDYCERRARWQYGNGYLACGSCKRELTRLR